jgi:hypothetical protein
MNNTRPGFIPIQPEEEEVLETQSIQEEPPAQEEPTPQAANNVVDQRAGFIPIQPEKSETLTQSSEEEPVDYWESFKRGVAQSAPGEIAQSIKGAQKIAKKQSRGFWDSVIQEGGTLAADAPVMALGGLLGGIIGLGASGGNPIGAATGGAFGTFALPEFIKESMREYRQFQEKGGDLTFGEFLNSADKVASKTLNAGLFGTILGSIRKATPLLEKIPGVKQLFDTKYAGSIAREAVELGGEIGTATTLPAALEGRLPDKEDVARAAVLFTGMRAAHLPIQLADVIKDSRSSKFNYALADRVQELDLAYPPIQEFKKNHNPIYKNSEALDQNLSAFDESYIGNIVSKINSISPLEFSSAHEAGSQMREMIKPIESTQSTPENPRPQRPVQPNVPLVQNPLMSAIQVISPQVAPSKAELGRRITNQYKDNRAAEKSPLDERYDTIREETSGIEIVDNELPNEIQEFIDQFGGGAIPGSQEAMVVQNARRMMDLLVEKDEKGEIIGYKNVPIQKLMSMNRSIKQIPNWQVPPEMKQNLIQLTGMVDAAIVGQLENFNPELSKEYTNLNQDYRNFKERYDNTDMRIFYDRTENSEAVANRFTNLDEFTQLEQALGGTPGGDQVLNLIRREVWQNRLGREAINARNETEFEAATRGLGERDFNDLMEFLTPEQREMAINAMNHSNQIRQSAIRSTEEFAQDRERYAQQINQWKQQEALRKKSDKDKAKEVQTKQDLLVSLLKEDPAKIVGNMNTIEGIKRVKEATSKVKGGQQLYDSLARYETERMFDFMREGYIRTGRAPYNEMKIQLNNKEFRAKLKELNGDNFVKEMDELVDLSDQLSDNFKETKVKFKDDPTTLNSILTIYSLLGLAHGDIMTPLMAFTAKKNVMKMGNKAYNMWTSKRNYDPEYIQHVLRAARAANKGNKEAIRRQASQLQPPFIPSTPRNPR